MKLTHSELESKINEYVDESYAFGDSEGKLIENVLKSLKIMLNESNGINKEILTEAANNSQGESKYIIEDFILYLENI